VVRLGYRPAFDGLRALAVFLVFCDHAGTRLRGAFVGVDIFFVLSGFLITSLLLEEWSITGRIALGAFYGRRVRRLLPALVLALILVGVLYKVKPSVDDGWSFAPTSLAVIFYAGNWVAAVVGANTLGALKHTWSLGIEEQFYLLWPLVLILGLRRRWRPRRLLAVVAGAAVLSAVLRGVVFLGHLGPDGTAAYLRSDTHADGLALGCLVAVAASTDRGRRILKRLTGSVLVVLAAGAFIGVAALAMRWTDRSTYLGGLAGVNIAAAIIVSHLLLADRSPVREVLALRPFVWFGKRSYGFYLFHLPILLALAAPTVTLAYWPWFVLCFAASLGAAALSYTFVESYFLRRRRYASPLQTREPVDLEPEPVPESRALARADVGTVSAGQAGASLTGPPPAGFEFRWDVLPRSMSGYDRESTELLFAQINARYRQLFEDRQGLRDDLVALDADFRMLREELETARDELDAVREDNRRLERQLADRDTELDLQRRENALVEEHLARHQAELAVYHRRELVVMEMVETAKKQADEIKADARAEASRALERARRRRAEDVRRSALERRRMRSERERLERAARELREKLSDVLVSTLRDLDGEAGSSLATNGAGGRHGNGAAGAKASYGSGVRELLETLVTREPS
jgi:peptidoglycan/LPS O-acetylase OafA/YrhL